ncbi:hypothetical protein C484_07771 [Natrialba taiwanensis DSM 12281]|uniref:Uncharacterized protein n=1 Tax=Natrialba taiwanensis DSM 12281 TaxID=1230458 RepID=M0A5Y6_9EURY|nr:hypothetical protein C484_07771 [Natrialba taiwanensis DSM 12281]
MARATVAATIRGSRSVDVNVFIRVLAVTVDDVSVIKCVVLVEWIVGKKSVSVDGQWLLLAVYKKETNHRFIGGFRGDYVSVAGATIDDCELGWFVLFVRSLSAPEEATRARRPVALAVFHPHRDVDFVDLDRTNEVERRCVERFMKALDVLVDRFVLDVDFELKLTETRVRPKKRVNREQPLSECNL